MGSVSAWPETLSSNEKRVMEELVNGKNCATQLQILFQNSSERSGRVSAQELVQKIFTSFDHSISLLTSAESAEVSQNQATSYYDSPCCKKRAASKEKRGCYKRRKSEQTWTVASATVEDGHAWRKYGQKQILNSEHPRGYFRCTRKYDQGCKATKQVQRMDDGSQMYQITYIGTHTCRPDSFKAPQIIKDSESWQSYKMVTPSNTTAIKQEAKETTTPTTSGLTDMDSVIMWKDILGADYGDVVSNVYSGTEITSQCLEMDLVIKPVEFEDEFQFDESEFV
ncbi:WRKY DNA-binding protein 70, ARABIDOPSIS THALIANA WRKY DNA-BINDING PROTEIN 70 [Hibiscus trionum]|uniref:WRKY DNA-binding protein 70, ARABIDOPSIS THALIANA WRKY DNA-BINDING PROTEIN 70 n=1 Tax=Hibiscus trionum TaxID=183268 RepID=A0A9W7HUK8_HIBTR|nr:WRKY DNA-binding protein 70, ARABIDOPSIS THALIANA WRKY DNA-BINDING PROTEIN 70 [Hibiscus trionum]